MSKFKFSEISSLCQTCISYMRLNPIIEPFVAGKIFSVENAHFNLEDGSQLNLDFQLCAIPRGNRSEFVEDVFRDGRHIFVRSRVGGC